MPDENDIKNLPDVDLGLDTQQDKGNQQTQNNQQNQQNTDVDLGQFKNPKDMLKSYKEIQAAFTKVSQDNKDLKQKLTELEETQIPPYTPPPPQQQSAAGQDFETAWMEDPQKAIDARVYEMVNVQRIQDILGEEQEKDPESFMERSAYAERLSQDPKYVHLRNSPGGVRQLFKIADKLRVENMKRSSMKSLEYIFGEPLKEEQLARLKQSVLGNGADTQTGNTQTDAYMPDTSTSTATGAHAGTGPTTDEKMVEAAKKGDVDGVLNTMFSDLMAE